MVPVNAPSISIQKSLVSAKTSPPTNMRIAIVATVRRRPYRSATIDQKIVITADPAIAAVKTRPTSTGPMPSLSRYSPRTTAR